MKLTWLTYLPVNYNMRQVQKERVSDEHDNELTTTISCMSSPDGWMLKHPFTLFKCPLQSLERKQKESRVIRINDRKISENTRISKSLA